MKLVCKVCTLVSYRNQGERRSSSVLEHLKMALRTTTIHFARALQRFSWRKRTVYGLCLIRNVCLCRLRYIWTTLMWDKGGKREEIDVGQEAGF